MAQKTIEDRIAQLEARTKALKARHATQKRAKETRLKIHLGTIVLNSLQHDKEFAEAWIPWFQRLLRVNSSEQDFELFKDLLPGPSEPPASNQPDAAA